MTKNRKVKSRKSGTAQYIVDADVPNLELRIGVSGRKSWTMLARFGGAKNSTRRTVGNAHKMPVAEARKIVLMWKEMNRGGVDPAEEQIRAQLEEERRNRATFRRAMEDYIEWLPQRLENRQVPKDQKTLRREFLDPERVPWIDTPLYKVSGVDVQTVVQAIRDRPAPAVAYDAFSQLKTFFKWAITPLGQQAYGISVSPVATLCNKDMKLRKNKRQRTPRGGEIRAYWMAAASMGYPWGDYFQWTMLSGQRNRDGREAQWLEFNLVRRIWTIPAARFKSKCDHIVALSVPMVQMLARIKARQGKNHGPYVFSFSNGWKPVGGVSQATDKFRKKAAEYHLAATGEQLEHFVIHDDRRTIRGMMSDLGVPAEVAEAVIGHMKKDLEEVYNTHPFVIQKRRAMHLLAEEIRLIIDDQEGSLEAEERRIPDWPTRWTDAPKSEDGK